MPTLTLNPLAPISENYLSYLAGTFTDPDLLDAHTVTVDWDDPNAVADSTLQLNATRANRRKYICVRYR